MPRSAFKWEMVEADTTQVRDSHSRNSYMASATFALSYSSQSAVLSFRQNGKPIRSERLSVPYWTWLDHFHREVIRDNTEAISPELLDQEAEVGQPLLQVGLLGYFGYELKRESLPGYHYVPTTEDPDTERADSELLFASTVLRLDNYTGDWTMFNLVRRSDADPIGDSIGAVSKVGLSEEEFSALLARVRDVFAAPLSPPYVEPHGLPSFVALDDEESYSDTIRAAKAAIKDGEAYELTLTTKFKAESPKVDPYALYLDLRERNPAPYSAFMHFAAHDNTILSSSPERFISVDANGVAEMKPIKGTLAVSPDFEENERKKTQLATDVKELAENLMVRRPPCHLLAAWASTNSTSVRACRLSTSSDLIFITSHRRAQSLFRSFFTWNHIRLSIRCVMPFLVLRSKRRGRV